ncbi:MAG: hypothetical protein WC389_10020 [Lutibacter sp.]|jgi:hypothetical protein
MKTLEVLIACEFSGIVANAFAKLGHNVTSCDLLPRELTLFDEALGKHYTGNVFDIINSKHFDLMVGFPPCTYTSYVATRHWNEPGRFEKRQQGVDFFKKLYNSNIEYICLENPLSYVITWKKYDQIIHPWQFGDAYNKRTCLWLKNLPKLEYTNVVEPISLYYKSGLKKTCVDYMGNGGKEKRKQNRSRFHKGIAEAMANQFTQAIYIDKKTYL